MGRSIFTISRLTNRRPPRMAAKPSTRQMLVMLEPTALPTTISGEPSTTAKMELTSSGSDVPMATMVRPTTYGGTPRKTPSSSAPSVNQSADLTRAMTSPSSSSACERTPR